MIILIALGMFFEDVWNVLKEMSVYLLLIFGPFVLYFGGCFIHFVITEHRRNRRS